MFHNCIYFRTGSVLAFQCPYSWWSHGTALWWLSLLWSTNRRGILLWYAPGCQVCHIINTIIGSIYPSLPFMILIPCRYYRNHLTVLAYATKIINNCLLNFGYCCSPNHLESCKLWGTALVSALSWSWRPIIWMSHDLAHLKKPWRHHEILQLLTWLCFLSHVSFNSFLFGMKNEK